MNCEAVLADKNWLHIFLTGSSIMFRNKIVPSILAVFIVFILIISCKAKSEIALVTSQSGVILRSAPSASSQNLEVLPLGEEVVILDDKGPVETIGGKTAAWFKVKHGSKEGFVFSAFISSDPSAMDRARMAKACNGTLVGGTCVQPWMARWVDGSTSIFKSCAASETLMPDGSVIFRPIMCPPVSSPYGSPYGQSDGSPISNCPGGGICIVAGGWTVDGERIVVEINYSYTSSSCGTEPMLAGTRPKYFIEKIKESDVPESWRKKYGNVVPRGVDGDLLIPEKEPEC